MAQPKTQDNQKVFQSATQNLQSFMGAVDNPSSAKNMETIYSNMAKLFDAFTQGALLEQGANSEILLRTVYRSLSDDFLKIVQDTDAVDKIAEVIKEKQESIEPEKVESAMVSETTKKVITKTLDPENYDPMSVILDFTDELQNAILQVKLNLTREYEQRKLAHDKSFAGQQEDIDRLNQAFVEQDDTTVSTLEQMSEEQETWKDEHLEKLQKLLDTFNSIDGLDGVNTDLLGLSGSMSKDKQIQGMLKGQFAKFNPKKVLADIKSIKTKADELQKLDKKKAELEKQVKKPEKKPLDEVKKQVKPDDKKLKEKEQKKPATKDDSSKKKEPQKVEETSEVVVQEQTTKETVVEKTEEEKTEEVKYQEQQGPEKKTEDAKEKTPAKDEKKVPEKEKSKEKKKESEKEQKPKAGKEEPKRETPAPKQERPPVSKKEIPQKPKGGSLPGQAKPVPYGPKKPVKPVFQGPKSPIKAKKFSYGQPPMGGKALPIKPPKIKLPKLESKGAVSGFGKKQGFMQNLEKSVKDVLGQIKQVKLSKKTPAIGRAPLKKVPVKKLPLAKLPVKKVPAIGKMPFKGKMPTPPVSHKMGAGFKFKDKYADLMSASKQKFGKWKDEAAKFGSKMKTQFTEKKKALSEKMGQMASKFKEKKGSLKLPKKGSLKLPKKMPAKLPGKFSKMAPKGLGKLRLYMKAKPVMENMGMVASPKVLLRKPGSFSLGKAVKANAKYNAKMIPQEIGNLTGRKMGKMKLPKMPKASKSISMKPMKSKMALPKKAAPKLAILNRLPVKKSPLAMAKLERKSLHKKFPTTKLNLKKLPKLKIPKKVGKLDKSIFKSSFLKTARISKVKLPSKKLPNIGKFGKIGGIAKIKGKGKGGDLMLQKLTTKLQKREKVKKVQKRKDRQKENKEKKLLPKVAPKKAAPVAKLPLNKPKTMPVKAAKVAPVSPKGKLSKPSVPMGKNVLAGKGPGKPDAPQQEGTKLKPVAKGGICTCPICGAKHVPGMHTHNQNPDQAQQQGQSQQGAGGPGGLGGGLNGIRKKLKDKKKLNNAPGGPGQQPPASPAPQQEPKKGLGSIFKNPFKKKEKKPNPEESINPGGVTGALSTMHDTLKEVMKNKKFKDSFMLKYAPLQKNITKQIGQVDKKDKEINKYTKGTAKGIADLKKGKAGKGSSIFKWLLNPLGSLAMIVVGGLIIITLIRIAAKKWAEAYMPPSDGSTMTIFGIQIPGWDTIKAIGIGVYNWLVYGLPNWWDRLSVFFGNIRKYLFGKKGIIKNGPAWRSTLYRIIGALIIGVAKKAYGAFFAIVSQLVALIPGWGTAVAFALKFVPLLITMWLNMLNSLYGKVQGAKEEVYEQTKAAQGATGKKFVKKLTADIKALGKNVKMYKGQMTAIPGLQTADEKGGKNGPRKAAIMRKVPMKYNKTFKNAQKFADQSLEKMAEDNEKKDKERIEKANKGSVIGRMSAKVKEINDNSDKITEMMENNKEMRDKYKEKRSGWRTWIWGSAAKSSAVEYMRDQIIETTINPEIAKLDAYIAALAKVKRFQGVKGPLYDPVAGWNAGYRIFPKDLLSRIPLEPFEEIHDKEDVSIGTPADEESDSKGFMPFKWTDSLGVVASVHPINFEIERAKAMRKLYEYIGQEAVGQTFWTGKPEADIKDFKEKVLLKKGFPIWRSWNSPTASKEKFDYENQDTVLFQSKFEKFINKFREGKIDHNNNTLETATGLRGDGFFDSMLEKFDDLGTVGKSALIGGAIGAYIGGPIGALVGAAGGVIVGGAIEAGKAIGKWAAKTAENTKRAFSYAKKREGEGAISRGLNFIGGGIRLRSWRGEQANGLKYGAVRDFMIDKGVISMFEQGQVINPVQKAIPLIDELISMKVLSKGSKVDDANSMHSLIEDFFSFAGIKGYKWENVKNNRIIQAGFAQSFLEYFSFKVLPEWNKAEQILSDAITYHTDEAKGKMYDELKVLHNLFSRSEIFTFMQEHLRFPMMQVTLIDYSNVPGGLLGRRIALMRLNHYRKELGIPTPDEKNEILDMYKPLWNKIPDIPDANLIRLIDTMKPLIEKAAYEAKYTGDGTYKRQLMKFFTAFMNEKNARYNRQKHSDKIVKKAGKVKTDVLMPPKNLKEIEDERKKKEEAEAKAAEEAKKKAEEENKKRLAEEAKRKHDLAIAEAIKKEAERIKKEEENYENILSKMISDPGKVTEKELESLGSEVENLKQEAENRIQHLPREQRELKLSLIRGDKVSDKTFKEIKDTAIGLQGSLQKYVEEVNKIPVGSIMAIDNQGGGRENPLRMADPDNIDMGD